MATYLVEAYLARTRDSELPERVHDAQTAAAELASEGRPVRYMRLFFLPEEETCFHLYEAESADAVREASARAGIGCERIFAVVDVVPHSSSTCEERSR
jgi:hypothetical protein